MTEYDTHVVDQVNGTISGGKHGLVHLEMVSQFATGGKIWVDDMSLLCDGATTKDACPLSGSY